MDIRDIYGLMRRVSLKVSLVIGCNHCSDWPCSTVPMLMAEGGVSWTNLNSESEVG